MSGATTRQRLRYWFDNTMARGTIALIAWLGVASAVLVVIFGILAVLTQPKIDGKQLNILDTLWLSLMRAMDPGNVGGDEGSPLFLGLMLGVTLGGLFVVAALVGVLTTGLEAKLDQLRKGRSLVVESGHTILLGWSEQLFTMISELAEAKESEKNPCVVVLADRDMVEMQDEIRDRLGSLGKLRVVCRTGSPTDPGDIDIVSPDHAGAILVLSPEVDDPDSHVIKTLLALGGREWSAERPHVVAAITQAQNLPPARLAGGREATVVDVDDIAARLVVQSSRQAGLSVVSTDLLDFGGDEIYMRPEPSLAGRTYGEALYGYETATVIGLRRDGYVYLNPPMDVPLEPTDEMIMLAEDDSLIEVATRPPYPIYSAMVPPQPQVKGPERVLILGWNSRAGKIVRELDEYVAPMSELHIANGRADAEGEIRSSAVGLRNLSVTHKTCDLVDRAELEALNIGTFRQVIVLADDSVAAEHADSRTLVTLLHLRDMETQSRQRFAIVSEMNDERNQKLAQVTSADDFVVSGKLISLLLTQLSENRHLAPVFGQLFQAEGSEIYLRPADQYVLPGVQIDFTTLIEAARRRGESAIGYRIQKDAHTAPTYGVRLNPPKGVPFMLGPGDRVIVLAED